MGQGGSRAALASRLRAVAPLLVAGPLPGWMRIRRWMRRVCWMLVSSVVVDPANERTVVVRQLLGATVSSLGVEVDAVTGSLCELSDPVDCGDRVLDAGLRFCLRHLPGRLRRLSSCFGAISRMGRLIKSKIMSYASIIAIGLLVIGVLMLSIVIGMVINFLKCRTSDLTERAHSRRRGC